ncbi:hypothetical protein D7X88_11105 [bacterium C-53]|nr:hypothetical protein [Lachnospiraceae bacterium]NBI03583.1 hypothetical protein [Lachnospiraceae bacterium]RKJ09351.1 hypothetical protein D7X88_11105 [bacterium C-53]
MSKNLENEYRKMIEQETPDLWSRIEAELPPKKKAFIYRFRRPYIHVAAGVAAAVVIVCVAVPFARTGSSRADADGLPVNKAGWIKHGEAPESGSEDAASIPETLTEEGISSEGRDQSKDTSHEMNSTPETEEDLPAPSDTVPLEAGSEGEESIEVADEDADIEGDFSADGGQEEILMAEASMAHEDVAVSVTGVKTVNGEKVYTAKVLKDTVSGLSKGDELYLRGDDSGEELREGNEYSVSFVSETSVSSQEVSGNMAEVYCINKICE